ncbi:MAG: hypothetical protein H7249_13070 [Chitinophagaceae bacterium]|nr:hypothetical protein [Oligoflexus sp.]
MKFAPTLISSLIFSILLASCGRSTDMSELKGSPELVQRAQEIHSEILNKLQLEFPKEKGSIWSSTTIDLKPDWMIQSPNTLWGLTASQIPENMDCNVTKPNCDFEFKRQLCNVTADCDTIGTECLPLDASVSRLGQAPRKMCLGMADSLIDRYYHVIVSSRLELDVASLQVPTGRFFTALINGLSVLSQKNPRTFVRFLFSGYDSTKLNLFNTREKILNRIVDGVRSRSPETYNRLFMNLTWFTFKGELSWNHSKIVVADGNRALVGGHNFLDEVYLINQPIFDLSMEYRGEGAAKARDFLNYIWNFIEIDLVSFPKDMGPLPTFSAIPTTRGTVNTLSVGRLGALGSNVSDYALRHLIQSAKTKVSIVQQNIYNNAVTDKFKTYVFDAIVDAAVRGLDIEIVLSNRHALVTYEAFDIKREYKETLEGVVDALVKNKRLDKKEAQQIACKRISMAPFRFSRTVKFWPSKTDRDPGVHSKFVMVDDASFYIGSHNLYPSNLQEFGNIVSDADAAAHVKAEFYDKVWRESQAGKLPCPFEP